LMSRWSACGLKLICDIHVSEPAAGVVEM
jgi:hypothetical protein